MKHLPLPFHVRGGQRRGDVQIASVEIYHRIGDEFSSTSGWVSCPVGKRYPMGR